MLRGIDPEQGRKEEFGAKRARRLESDDGGGGKQMCDCGRDKSSRSWIRTMADS